MYLATGYSSARQTCQAGGEQSKDAWQLEDLEGGKIQPETPASVHRLTSMV